MSVITPSGGQSKPTTRVRHDVKDGLLVMGISLALSAGLTLVLASLGSLGH